MASPPATINRGPLLSVKQGVKLAEASGIGVQFLEELVMVCRQAFGDQPEGTKPKQFFLDLSKLTLSVYRLGHKERLCKVVTFDTLA
ncbi:hypothetical protein PROH_16500 [Prochlorothrix hollandica PCC 9006 = CALU 1027]|uniref:Uncharacterized protein n=1 Tax=Prochlorothrix hollandica PCC 9006 = CALU 1027 TaxID=317619 RepID=A0A0M2PS17_PROHO|nr:hypothetical protein PROH_16500 [Prochlorothrix hollandica PCC 9006 = CALU 1027]